MKFAVTVMAAAMFGTAACAAAVPKIGQRLPKAIVQQLPAGFVVMNHVAGQLDLDGLTDYLVVVHRPDDSYDKPSPRPLLLFQQVGGDGFKLAARNDTVVMRANEGGQCDPFEDDERHLTIKNHYFTVENWVACGNHWSDYITFRYDAASKEWLFHKRIVQSMSLNDDPNGDALKQDPARVTKADAQHPVRFADWRYPR
jgi:hypothetical protein